MELCGKKKISEKKEINFLIIFNIFQSFKRKTKQKCNSHLSLMQLTTKSVKIYFSKEHFSFVIFTVKQKTC